MKQRAGMRTERRKMDLLAGLKPGTITISKEASPIQFTNVGNSLTSFCYWSFSVRIQSACRRNKNIRASIRAIYVKDNEVVTICRSRRVQEQGMIA